jgi:hypothetical protein
MNSVLSAVGAGISAGSDADGILVVQQQRVRITGQYRLVSVVLEENNATESLRTKRRAARLKLGVGRHDVKDLAERT